MRILGIGGFARGSGKTTLVTRVLEILPGWGALKSSPGPHRHGLEALWDLSADPARLSWPAPSAWLRSLGSPPPAALAAVRARFDGLEGLVVEGITVSVALDADRLYLVARAGAREVKPSAAAALGRVHAIVLNTAAGDAPSAVEAARELARAAAPALRLIEVDAADPAHPGTRRLLDEIRDWAAGAPTSSRS